MSENKPRKLNVFLRGGLGNQLFQYASGLAIARSYDRTLVLREDLLPANEDLIGGVSRWPNQIKLFNHSSEIDFKSHQPPFSTNFFGKAMALQRAMGDFFPMLLKTLGIHAAEKRILQGDDWVFAQTRVVNAYMSHLNLVLRVRDQVASEVRQIRFPSDEFISLSNEATTIRPTIIHVRLGDYLGLKNVFGELGEIFYAKALEELGDEPRWIFTQRESEVPSPILKAIKPDRVIDETLIPSSIENLVLMSLGSNLIASNSTLSWWSAILSSQGTKIVAPYFQGKTNNFSLELTLPAWTSINVD